ncbi:MAG TPA: pyridoxamine 5'-phosphate oxidase [Kiritimatiellia bacterium]|mgnify:CR=1 FL=1|nr:pyridoxamine 5'-phosphate oxidase [Kiritimatiellia bacterium]
MGLLARVLSIRGLTRGLRETDLTADPLDLFDRWFRFARTARIFWPDSTALATASTDGKPSVRMVLLKAYDTRGFVFYTNYESQKGRELEENPYASMVMYWNDLVRQVRMTGPVEKISREDSERYFHRRPRGSQIGAWASNQDSVVASRAALMEKYDAYEKQFAGQPVPLPPYWGGYRLIPEAIEFWQGRTYRLHDRFRYTRKDGAWAWVRISP